VDDQPVTGRITSIAVDPSDPSGNTIYVSAANGGVWKTTNFLTTDGAVALDGGYSFTTDPRATGM